MSYTLLIACTNTHTHTHTVLDEYTLKHRSAAEAFEKYDNMTPAVNNQDPFNKGFFSQDV